MATKAEIRRLTQAHRAEQSKRAARVAVKVAQSYSRVDPSNIGAVETWLLYAVPLIVRGSDEGGGLAAKFASALRLLEVGKPLRFAPVAGSVEDQVRRSLSYLGPETYFDKVSKIGALDVPDQQRQALLRRAKEETVGPVAASAVRHTLSSGRETLTSIPRQDPDAIGWVRVTSGKPCFFCAMLASRGPVYDYDSFADSDIRFSNGKGRSNVKVHDGDRCSLKPLYDAKTDPLVEDTEKFADMWSRWGAGGSSSDTSSLNRFRRGYDHWAKTGEYLDWDVVNDTAAFRKR